MGSTRHRVGSCGPPSRTVERTPQRVAWMATTEEFLMQFKRAAPVLGIAAAVVLAIIAFQIIGTRNVGDPDPTPRAYSQQDL